MIVVTKQSSRQPAAVTLLYTRRALLYQQLPPQRCLSLTREIDFAKQKTERKKRLNNAFFDYPSVTPDKGSRKQTF